MSKKKNASSTQYHADWNFVTVKQNRSLGVCFIFVWQIAGADDTNPPNIVNCPESVLNYEFQEREDNYEVFWRTPTATDDLNLPIAVSSSHSNRDRFPIGSTDVTYIFTDVVGNVATCRFEVYISG